MNFQSIPPVINSKDILDIAFKKARIKGKQKNLKGNWLQIIRKKESLKLDIIKDSITVRLEKILQTFPEIRILPPFYIKLMELTIDLPHLRQSLIHLQGAIKRISNLQREYVHKVNKEKEKTQINELSKQFYGRISSVINRITTHLNFLEKARLSMKTYPDIKEMFTVCIYGFPNVGKTTLLNKLTNSKAKTAAYAFTTKSINSGYFTTNGKNIQFLDVPGTLARDKLNNIEMQAELVLTELADLVIYVYDITEQCGFSIEQQQKLFKRLDHPKVLIYLSKKDLLDEKKLLNWKKHHSIEEIKKEIGKLA
jgi:nucleolar GTP-binding protein